MMKQILLGCVVWGAVMGCAKSSDLDLEGGLYMKGSTPHSYMVIEDQKSHKSYKIKNPEAFNLAHRQNESVKITAKFLKKAIGPGFPAVIEVLSIKN